MAMEPLNRSPFNLTVTFLNPPRSSSSAPRWQGLDWRLAGDGAGNSRTSSSEARRGSLKRAAHPLRAVGGCAMRCRTWTTERDHRLEAAQAATPARSHAQAAELLLTVMRDRPLSEQCRLPRNPEVLRYSIVRA